MGTRPSKTMVHLGSASLCTRGAASAVEAAATSETRVDVYMANGYGMAVCVIALDDNEYRGDSLVL